MPDTPPDAGQETPREHAVHALLGAGVAPRTAARVAAEASQKDIAAALQQLLLNLRAAPAGLTEGAAGFLANQAAEPRLGEGRGKQRKLAAIATAVDTAGGLVGRLETESTANLARPAARIDLRGVKALKRDHAFCGIHPWC